MGKTIKIIDYKTGNSGGFNFSPEMLLGKYIQEMPIPEWREQAEQSLEKSLEKIKASLHEKEVLLKLVLSLTKQRKGKITHHHRNGAEFRIEFKPAEKNRRKLHS